MAYFVKNADLVVVDSADDISNIPTHLNNIGAIAVVSDTGAQYILSPSRIWVEFSTGGGGGGGGSGGGVLVVNVTTVDEEEICDKTAGEIYAACPAVIFVFGTTEYMNVSPLVSYGFDDSGYAFVALLGTEYTAATANDYPTASEGPK